MEKYLDIERSIIKTYRKCIWRRFIRGINDYKMMNEGDKIAVCVSGSAKSAVLAKCAQEIHRHGVVKFDLCFITADTGLGDAEKRKLTDNARLLNIPLEIFKAEGDLTDCLFEKARSLGCDKIALGHHFDDAIERILENMLFEGKIAALMPKEKSGKYEGMDLIRPLCNVKEKDIAAWTRFNGLEFTEQKQDGEMKELVKRFRDASPYIDKNIMSSVKDVNLTTVIAYHGKGREYNFMDDYEERGNKNA